MHDSNEARPGEGDARVERELIGRAQAGDSEAQDELFAQHYSRVLAFIRLRGGRQFGARESSTDLAQSVCRKAFEDLGRFEYRGARSFRNWLLTYAKNKIANRRRHHAAPKRSDDREDCAALSQIYATIASPSRAAIVKESVDQLERAFDELSEDDRELILMHRIEGLSHAEIGERIGKSEVASRRALSRALVRLAAKME